MLAKMSNFRKPIRTVFTILSAVGGITVFHEFGVKYAEQKGWYDNLPDRVEAALNWLVSLSEPLWFKVGVAFIAGVTTGLWLDAFLRKRERQSVATPAVEIDREALAKDAEQVSANLLTLVAQFESRKSASVFENRRDPEQVALRMGELEGQILERYAERHQADVWRVINTARKVLPLDFSDHWHASHAGVYELPRLAQYLLKLASDLRHPMPNFPLHDKHKKNDR